MHWNFAKGQWDPQDFIYAHSPHVKKQYAFLQQDDNICNFTDADDRDFAYISMAAKKVCTPGAVLQTRCSFASYGAPLLVLACGLNKQANKETLYDLHYEVVAYEGGCNVWMIAPDATDLQRGVKITNLCREQFLVKEGLPLQLTVATAPQSLTVTLNDTCFTVPLPNPLSRFYAGMTACEGINTFYDFTVEES